MLFLWEALNAQWKFASGKDDDMPIPALLADVKYLVTRKKTEGSIVFNRENARDMLKAISDYLSSQEG